MAAVQVIDYLENGNIKNSVNLPDAEMAISGDTRICVIHKNVPAIISKLTTVLSGLNINIENMLNKSKNRITSYNVCYTKLLRILIRYRHFDSHDIIQ